MTKLQFTIHGNQDDHDGNPLGYKRMLKQHMRADSVKYLEWCNYVRNQFHVQTRHGIKRVLSIKEQLSENPPKPLTSSRDSPAKMDIMIMLANDIRPDPDNIFKGIADALFENDKYVMDGSFKTVYNPEKKGQVLVTITVEE